MKASLLKRLQNLEHAGTAQGARQVVLIEVMKMPDADRVAYWAGDEGVLRRYGAPDPVDRTQGEIHTVVIDIHPSCRDDRDDFDEDDA